MNYNYQIIKSIIVNLENRVLTHELEEIYLSPNSWRKSVYRFCRKNFEKQERRRMSYDIFKIRNNSYFKESERGKWNRKISTLTASNFTIVNDDEDRIQRMILKLERKRLDTTRQLSDPLPLTRLIENFNRRKTDVTRDEWDIPILHLVKKFNWKNS
ncbi:hypothetical protein [Leptospira ellinghausenii]|uniref:hypothetical protein n=1 Tax=Leptospira ellinghausenii TaxID=1917822 RepID=UPI00107F348C|nr:hypothetical protein [Leptospira ellinghausenii]